MDKKRLVQRECYLYKDGRPIGIVTDRVFARRGRKNDPRSITYEHVPHGIRPALKASDRTGAWVEYGYWAVRPTAFDPEHNYGPDIRNLPWDDLLDPDTELPRPDKVPPGYEPFFVTGLRAVEGPYEEALQARRNRAKREALAIDRACAKHDALADRVSRFLPAENPVLKVGKRVYKAPEGVTLSFSQLERLLRQLER